MAQKIAQGIFRNAAQNGSESGIGSATQSASDSASSSGPPKAGRCGFAAAFRAAICLRDSGLLHYLLGIRDVNDLMGHPGAGASWEGFGVEHILNQLPKGATASFYRTAAGAELDLVVDNGSRRIGFEIKFSTAPKPTKGFWQACEDVGVERAYVVAPVREGWPMAQNVDVIGLGDVAGCLG